MNFVIIALLLALAALWLKSRASGAERNASGKPQRPKRLQRTGDSSTSAEKRNAFHAVSIKHGATACSPVLELQSRRFLSAEAPHIPLHECDIAQCQCKYRHHKDRRHRDGARRSFSQGHFAGQERRILRGRRAEDSDDDYAVI